MFNFFRNILRKFITYRNTEDKTMLNTNVDKRVEK